MQSPQPLTANQHNRLGRSDDIEAPSHSGPFLLANLPDRDALTAILIGLGRFLVGLSFIVFGIQHFWVSGFIGDLGLVPQWAPAPIVWAWLAGAALLLTGASILAGRYARFATFVLGFVFLITGLLRFTARIPGMLHSFGNRGVFCEFLAFCAGSWMLSTVFPADLRIPSLTLSRGLAAIGLPIFALATIVLGYGHFQLPGLIASLIPAWIPFRLFFAWFTGCALVAAGLAMAARIQTRLAATLLGIMYFSWVLIVHAPRIAHALYNVDEWNSGYVCLAMAGFAFIVAALSSRSQARS